MSRAILVAVLTASLFAGCGGDSEQSTPEPPADARAAGETDSHAYVPEAERICAGLIAKSRQMGAEFREIPQVGVDALTLTTRELVKPAVPILESNARKLRTLQAGASVAFDSYVALFDPIVSVVRERVRAGEGGDGERAHELELVLSDLSNLQRSLAREAGLRTCDVDFIQAFSSAEGPR